MHQVRNTVLAVVVIGVAAAMWAGCQTSTPPAPILPPIQTTNLKPSPNAPYIANITARMLEELHYSRHPLDQEMSKRFFDGYINSLDPRHENFLQSDLAEFDLYRTNLDQLTINRQAEANLTPAFAIYGRFSERIQQHSAYVGELLKQGKFKFNSTDENIVIDRRQSPFPKDLEAAEELWRQRLRYDYLQEKLSLEIVTTNDTFVTVKLPPEAPKEISEKLAKRYRWNQHSTTNWDSDEVLQVYLNALANAYDPHSDYMSAPKAQDFSINMNLALVGIGAQLTEDDGYCTIRSLIPGGPAARSKEMNEKDRIIAVAQSNQPPVEVVDMELGKVVQQIRGQKGTEVRLTISPVADRAARKVVKLVRDEIKLEDSEAKAKLIEFPNGQRIGIIELPSFYATVNLGNTGQTTPKSTSVDVAKLINKLKQENVSGIIIDLRTNPGGSLEEAIRFTGLFIKDGPVVIARDHNGRIASDSDPDPTQLYDGPLVVMINRFSASASEIAAGALQDYDRAVIVGDISTHGKGTVQNLNQLKQVMPGITNDPGTLKITIRKFYRISGASTQLKGVVPDIVLPDVLNYSTQIGESSLENALPYDTIRPASYDKFNLVQPYLARLKTNSNERIATNQDFRYVQQDIAQFLKMQTNKTVPINEAEAIKERKRNFAQAKARDAERTARKPDGMKIYEITVKNSEQPGLVEYQPDKDTTTTATSSTGEDSPVVSSVTNIITGSSSTLTLVTNVIAQGTNNVGTNIVKSAASDKKTPPPFDPMLEETERIMQDYIQLLSKSRAVVVHQ
jgi:carboxyl-terminal processing protease